MYKAGYQTQFTLALAHLLDVKNPETLKAKSPEAYKHYEKMHDLYRQIDETGYEELRIELYERRLG